MCNVAVKKQQCNSLKFTIFKKKTKEKVKDCFKDDLFMLFGKKRYYLLVKIIE